MGKINTTYRYHKDSPLDLLREFTLCESLATKDSPYMIALKKPKSYGAMIGELLVKENLLKQGSRIMEIGGGYGNLIKGLLEAYAELIEHVCMIDLSKKLLRVQRKNLSSWNNLITFINADATEIIAGIKNTDLIILNEMIGDLDTWTDIDAQTLPNDVAGLVKKYDLEIPEKGLFNLNIGAIQIVEQICKKKIPVFLSEHSSDPIIPEAMEFLKEGLMLNGFSREIKLFGHSESTIRFSHLIHVAKAFGRKTSTGSLAELVGIKNTEQMRFVFTSHACMTEEQEIIFELLDHIREYRWLVIY